MDAAVSAPVLLGFALNIFICTGLPVLLGILLWRHNRKSGLPRQTPSGRRFRLLLPLLAGAAVFTVSQLILRLPLLNLLGKTPVAGFLTGNLWVYAVFLGLTASIFEECGRFIGFRCLKDRLSWEEGVAFGIGHAGAEAILLVGLQNVNNLANALLINSGSYARIVALAGIPAEQAQAVMGQFAALDLPSVLLGGVERILAMAVQIALSLVVLYGVRSRKPAWLFVAIGLHMLIDAPLPLLQSAGVSVYLIEGIVAVEAAVSLWFILWSKKRLFSKPALRQYPPLTAASPAAPPQNQQ